MNRTVRILGASLIAWAFSPAAIVSASDDFFEKKIRPVLVEHCYKCHSAEAAKAGKLKGGLLLDTRDGTLKGGDSGPAVVPRNVTKSLLIAAMRHDDLKMPPKGKLPDAVIADFETWVKAGAPDPRVGSVSGVAVGIDWVKARQFWAFVPPVKSPVPKGKDAVWPMREIDHFVLAEQEKRQLKPVGQATKPQWIRRATLDLIGLPPTLEEIDAFEKDTSAEAYARVVDRLLASPHYGERWGRYWLDLARYTDDLGGTVEPVLSPNAYRYRDWVIQAFNRDIPYDQFVRLQLAGDLIASPTSDYVERLGGLGFQGLGQQFSGNAVGMVKKKVADELDDRTDTVTRTMLGLTVSCARCHDHKFDPIPTKDYYSLTAAYNGTDWKTERMLASPKEIEAFKKWESALAAIKVKVQQLPADESQKIGREEIARIDAYLAAAWKVHTLSRQKRPVDVAGIASGEKLLPVVLARWVGVLNAAKPIPFLDDWQAEALTATTSAPADGDLVAPASLREKAVKLRVKLVEALAQKAPSKDQQELLKAFLLNNGAPFKLTGDEAVALMPDAMRKQHDANVAELDRLTKSAPAAPPKSPSIAGGGQAMQVNIRGNPEQLGEPAAPGFLQILRADKQPDRKEFTRLELADAIASRGNPLTARVYVNRVWQYHFGRGIVGTPGNFGKLGDRPTHPEMLDTLAVRFMDAGWSTKWLHREIMLSATYRLGSATDSSNATRDAENHYLWRTAPRRLDFEAWRDSMLAVAGRLDTGIGGPPTQAGKQLHPEDPANARRTVYGFISRFKPNPTLTLFDFPEPNVTSDRRNVTTIPQQQLFALNSPFMVAMAKGFAARVAKAETQETDRIRLAWRLAYGRLPDEREVTLSLEFLRSAEDPKGGRLTAWEQLCQSLLASNEFAFVN